MLRKQGKDISYRQAFAHIVKMNNLGANDYLKEISCLKSFLSEMKVIDWYGHYEIETKYPGTYQVNNIDVDGSELVWFYVGWGWTHHFIKNARPLLQTDA
mmetsp:Transcript_18620/g.26222  ORF Transcript_18620/g.26222 Transcript_18620/m.26222 type:complete len:100 (-) Transcript_18620:36-335(-)